MNELMELADKIEAAGDDSFCGDLTADIYEALGYEVIRRPRGRNGIAWKYRGNGPLFNNERWVSMGRLTWSVDAAIDLVPEGASWNLQGNTSIFYATVKNHSGKGATSALALCAAALRARASTEPGVR